MSFCTSGAAEGEVLTCGSGSYGRPGNIETLDQLYLEPVELMGAEDVTQIAGGYAFILALNRGGIAHAWGRNNEGQIRTGMGKKLWTDKEIKTLVTGVKEYGA